MLNLDQIKEAQKVLTGVARKTPLESAPKIMENLYIKAECLQFTGSFKLRGAYNKIHSLTDEEKKRGVIACSAGNHAQGVAYSATKCGIKSYICMPEGAPITKVEATRGYGAEVILVPGIYDDAAAEAARLSKEKGYTFAHPFNDEYVMAGQGTIGLEILDQLPDVDQVVVPIGGGGLISGVAVAIKSIKPSCKVIGVQAKTVPSMQVSINNKKITTVPDGATLADGIHVLTPGDKTFECCSKYVDEVVTVEEEEIAAAILSILENQKLVAEGAGATTVAACMFGKVDTKNKKTVCIVTAGNIDVTTLSHIITAGLKKTGRITNIDVVLQDKPGSLVKLLSVISKSGANIFKVNHIREDAQASYNTARVNVVCETKNPSHCQELAKAIIEAGYSIL